MYIWGLHILDLSLIIIYTCAIIWLGKKVAGNTKDTNDFFLAGRKLGKFYQFFLNFGCSTNADQAVAVSREIYRQGIGGMWIQFLVLFLTPFYWFTTLLFRRVRLTTIGDYFTERFESKFLGGSYAIFILVISILGGGVGYMVAAKTMIAMTPKPMELCTVEERRSVEEFGEFRELSSIKDAGFTEDQQTRYEELSEKSKLGELRSFISYTDPIWFYFIYAIVVGIYTMLGGFRAAAITDAIQGVLIIIFSALLIPAGLAKIGGFSGLHASVPDYMFLLFGSATMSEYAWHTIFAMALANLVSIVAVVSGMQTAGSATNEMTARIGMIGGMFTKRIIMIFWALAGLIAIGIYSGQLHDPDLIWGFMTKDLLFPGAIGLMLVGILAANMSSLDAGSVAYSALFIKNLYKPYFPDKSEEHYLFVGRIVIGVTLLGGIGVAMYVNNLLELFKYIISVPGIFGAAIWLGFIWRRLTRWAVILQVILCIIIYTVIPNLFQNLDSIRYNPDYLEQTHSIDVTIKTKALNEDVESGAAEYVGEEISKSSVIAPYGIYFEQVARIDPEDPNSQKIGLGRFHAEIWILNWFGIDFSEYSKAGLVTSRFLFDALFPFVLLFLLSGFTRPAEQRTLDRFFAKMHTPVQPTDQEEELALESAYNNPGQFENKKILRGSSWEILKPGKMDYIGFFGSWLLVGLVIFLLWVMVSIK